MLEVLVALDVTQRHMKNQFETEAPRTRANVRRVGRKHRSPFRAASALAMRILVKGETTHRSGRRVQTASSDGDQQAAA
jgi:hypothetical protein